MKHSYKITAQAYYIPSINKLISRRNYIDMYKKCKANPGARVPQTITKWYGGTTDDIIKEIQKSIHDKINNR